MSREPYTRPPNAGRSSALVLIVEDDPAMRRGLRDNFAASGYRVLLAADGESGLAMALERRPELVILDVMLPGLNGFEFCRELRREGSDAAVIMLTARDHESDVLLGLGLGADDYVTKPFSIRELLARSEALLRRLGGGDGPESLLVRIGGLLLDRTRRELRDEATGETVPLSPKEYALLDYLAARPGRAVSREQIMNDVWGYDAAVTLRSIDRFVATLRRRIEPDPKRPRHLQTVREFGYRFEP